MCIAYGKTAGIVNISPSAEGKSQCKNSRSITRGAMLTCECRWFMDSCAFQTLRVYSDWTRQRQIMSNRRRIYCMKIITQRDRCECSDKFICVPKLFG